MRDDDAAMNEKREKECGRRFVISAEWMGQLSNRRVNLQMRLDPHSLTLARPDPLHAVKTSPLTRTSISIANM